LAALQRLAEQERCELGDLWLWPLSRLKQKLRWSDRVLQAVQAERSRWGDHPDVVVPDDVLIPGDAAWPSGLSRMKRSPMALFWQGKCSLWSPLGAMRSVAIVGTRRPSAHGQRMAETLGACLARAGWPVVSGLAEGVDAAAHRGCLRAGGCPVGVVGTPLRRVYPPEHAQLQAAVSDRGLLISEQAPQARVSRASFALRNRLLVALAATVVVVECPEGSGALISAEIAREHKRDLWVVPADALRHSARGSNALLGGGARPLLDPDRFVAALGAGPCQAPIGPIASMNAAAGPTRPPDQALLRLLEDGAGLESLAHQLGRPTGSLAEELFQLELQGVVRAEPGMRWCLA